MAQRDWARSRGHQRLRVSSVWSEVSRLHRAVPPHPSAGERARRVTPRGQAPPNGPAFILAHRTKPKRRKPYYLNKTGSLPSPPGSSPPRLAVRSTAAGRGPHDTSLFQRQSRVRKWLLLAVACPPRGPRWPLDSRTGGIAAQRRRVWGWRRRDECSHGTLGLCSEQVKHAGHLPTPGRAPGAAKEAAAGLSPPFTRATGNAEARRAGPLGSSQWSRTLSGAGRRGPRKAGPAPHRPGPPAAAS